MKSNLEQLKRYISSKKNSRKNFILSVVALVEVFAILVVSTYAWVESASTIIIESNGDQKIDTYVYTDANMNDEATNTAIHLDKYYRESGNMHFASATCADGNNVYFPRLASASAASIDNSFRKGVINDVNTNYISFSFRVKANVSNNDGAKFIFQNAPVIKVNGANIADSTDTALKNSVRIAVNDGTTTNVFSNVALNGATSADQPGGTIIINGSPYYPITHAFSDYSGNKVASDKRVLSVNKGATKTVTVTVWLQDPNREFNDAQIEIEDFNLILDTSSLVPVFFEDYTTRFNTNTTGGNDFGWATSGDTKMFVKDGNSITEMTKAANPTNRWVGYVEKQSLLKKKAVEFYSCPSTATAATAEAECICKWTANYMGNEDDVYYKAYGEFKNESSKLGYGTWGSLSEIRFAPDPEETAALAALPLPTSLDNMINVTLKTNSGFSGCDAVEMTFDNSTGFNCWRAYIPKVASTSKNLVFTYTRNNKAYTYNAEKRSTSEDISKYFTTSDSTGYWQPPATIKVHYATGVTENMGTISVSGGAPNAKTVKVTAGTTGIKLTATPYHTDSESYAFLGWYSDAACTEKLTGSTTYTVPTTVANETYNYYAKFKRQYKIILHAVSDEKMDNATGGTVQQTGGLQTTTAGAKVETYVLEGENVTITAAKKASHNFGGWYYMREGNYVEFDTTNLVKTFKVTENLVLYAKFNIKQFTIESQAKYEILNEGNLGTGDRGGTVTINNDSQAASKAYVTITVNYDGTATFKAFEKGDDTVNGGYKFAGWYTNEACTTAAPNAGSYKYTSNPYTTTINDSTTHDGKLKLYAKYVLKTYTAHAESTSASYGKVCVVTGTTPGASSTSVSKTIKYGESVTFRAIEVNSKFAGWYTSATGGTLITSEKDISFAAPAYLTSGSNLNVYARFTPNTYDAIAHAGANGKVKVGSNGWSAVGGSSTTKVEHGKSTTFYAEANEGYEFKGWYTSSAYSGTPESTSASYTKTGITNKVELYAKFDPCADITMYFYNASDWTEVHAYCWKSTDDSNRNGDYPGPKITHLGGRIWTYTYNPSKWDKVIFNQGNDTGKTNDLDLPGTGDTNTYYKYIKDGTNNNDNWIEPDLTRKVTVESVANATVTATYSARNATGTMTSYTINEGGNANVYVGTNLTLSTGSISTGYKLAAYTINGTDKTVSSGTTMTYNIGTTATTISAKLKVTSRRIYLKPNSDWMSSTPRFAAFVTNDSSDGNPNKWYSMSQDGNSGYYYFDLEENYLDYKYIIFCRMKGNDSTNKWGNVWNQTPDGTNVFETIPNDKNCFTLNSGWSGCGGTWSTR